MRTLLPLSLLLLSGCLDVTQSSGGSAGPPSTSQSGGGTSSGSGGSGGGSSPPASPPPAGPAVNPTGIWDVVDTVNGNAVNEVALIAGGKYLALAAADQFGCTGITGGTYAIDGSMFTSTGVALLMNGCNAPNGQGGYLPYTFHGYLTGTELNLSFNVDAILLPTLGATMDPLYNETSSLAKLAGNWNDAGNTLTVNADGTFSEQQASGCVVTGAYIIIDATHNLYGVSFEITNCTSGLAGIAFNGLGYLDDSNPNALHFIEDVSGPDPVSPGGTVLLSDNITPQ